MLICFFFFPTASFAALGAAAGCLASRSLMDAFGPRGTMLLGHVVCAIGWVLTVGSATAVNFLTGRFLTGVFVGLVSVAATAYNAECFPGLRSARPVVYTAVGVLCVYLTGALLNYAQTAVVVVATTVVSFTANRVYVPESPAWLTSRGRIGDAEYAKLRLRLVDNGGGSAPDAPPPAVSLVREWRRPAVYKPFLALCVHFALQQLSGPLVIVSYAAEMVGDSGVRILNSYFIAVALAAFLVVGALVSTAMDHSESAAVLSATGVLVSGALIAAYNLFRRLLLNRLAARLLSFVPLLGLAVFMMSSSVALVPSVPIKHTPGEHAAVSFSYLVAFLAIKSYPYAQAFMGWWVFAFFGIASALNIVYGVLVFSDSSEHPSDSVKNKTPAV